MDRAARNRLVVENLPLVGYLVSEVCARASHLSRDDLASAGALALVTAADAFNPDLGIPFGAYARKRIVGAFADDMRASDWASRGTRRRIKDTMAVQETLTASLGRTPTVDELAAALGTDRETTVSALADASRTVSALDDMTAEFLAADTVLPEESLLESEKLRYLHASVDALPERMRLIVRAIYFEDRTVKEVAEELGITHSAVSQQRTEAMRLLRDGFGTHYADDPAVEYTPESRTAPARRAAYLARMAEGTMAGMARALQPAVLAHTSAAS